MTARMPLSWPYWADCADSFPAEPTRLPLRLFCSFPGNQHGNLLTITLIGFTKFTCQFSFFQESSDEYINGEYHFAHQCYICYGAKGPGDENCRGVPGMADILQNAVCFKIGCFWGFVLPHLLQLFCTKHISHIICPVPSVK